MGTFYAGMKLNPLDLSPNYSATLMAITNGIGSITGIVTPYLVGALTPNVSIFFYLFEERPKTNSFPTGKPERMASSFLDRLRSSSVDKCGLRILGFRRSSRFQ